MHAVPANEHKFWGGCDDEKPVTAAQLGYGKRAIALSAAPVQPRMCRAPLGDGRVCPRMNVDACTFHGKLCLIACTLSTCLNLTYCLYQVE